MTLLTRRADGSPAVGTLSGPGTGDGPHRAPIPQLGTVSGRGAGDGPQCPGWSPTGDGGFVAAEWAIGMVVLVVPVLLLLAVLPSWAAQREAAGAAAREAARIAAAAPAEGSASAVAGARALLAGRGVDLTAAQITVTLPPGDQRSGAVTASVRLSGRTTVLPLFGPVTGPAATAVHVQPLDPHRSRS